MTPADDLVDIRKGSANLMWHSPSYKQVIFASPPFPTFGSDHLSIDSNFTLRAEDALYTSRDSANISLDFSTSNKIKGFLTAEARSCVRCSTHSITAGHQRDLHATEIWILIEYRAS